MPAGEHVSVGFAPPSPMDQLKAYSDELALAHPQQGYPLAEPQPETIIDVHGEHHRLSPIEVGDVGYIFRGQFIRMFNAHLDAGVHGQPRESDLPDDFVPLRRTSRHYREHRAPVWKSQSVVTRSLHADASGSPLLGASAGFASTTARGAVLYTPDVIECHDASHISLYKQYAKSNIERWHKFAVQDLHLEIEIEDIIFVTGVDRTTSWATAVFTKASLDVNFGITVQYANVAGVQLAANFSWQHAQDVWVNSGPPQSQMPLPAGDFNTAASNSAPLSPLNTIRDQSIFIRRIRCKRRRWQGIKLVANGQPKDLDREDNGSDDSQSMITVTSYPAREKFSDNLDPVLDFILDNSNSDIAIAHDEDLELFSSLAGGNPADILQGDAGFLQAQASEPSNMTDIERLDAGLSSSSLHSLHSPDALAAARQERSTPLLESPPSAPPPNFGLSSAGGTFNSLLDRHNSEGSNGTDLDAATVMPSTLRPREPRILPPLHLVSRSPPVPPRGFVQPIPANYPPPPGDLPPPPPRRSRLPPPPLPRSPPSPPPSPLSRTHGVLPANSWLDRPESEDVFERLEQWFPNHDLDKPFIENSSLSGEIFPKLTEFFSAPTERRHKKSIRVVAEEHKNQLSGLGRSHAARIGKESDVSRKKSTQLWDSKVEEVTPGQIRAGMPTVAPESPAGAASAARKPIFKWVRGGLIGKGNFGRVYLAMNVTTGEMIAVKQVEIPRTASDRQDTRQANVVEALKLESETLKDLDHPNIVQCLGFEETPTFLSIFLEYVPGGSVGGILRKYGRFDEDVTKSFTAQILSGLEYLHSKGILHRDMKADNILVEQTGVCKISDFGINKRTEGANEQAMMTAMQGTIFWMAPEVVSTGKRGDSKVDIWSVGCIVLEMWAGERPWNEQEAMAVIVKLYSSKQAPPVPSGVVLSKLADDFRRKCFAVNPDERPSAAELGKHPYLVLPPDWSFTGFTPHEISLEKVERI